MNPVFPKEIKAVRNEERLAAYFRRIGLEYSSDMRPSKELLRELQYAHCTHVPYENLDIIRGIPLSLKIDDVYAKIVNRGAGGYCFELNGAFGYLLRMLGYRVTDFTARFLRGESEVPMRRHRVLRVEVPEDGTVWLADVGVGQQVPRYPLELREDTVQKQFGEAYKFIRDENYGWVLFDYRHGEWKEVFAFTEEVQLDIDFEMPSFWCEKHPDSPFISKEMFSIKTADGRITLDGKLLKIFSKDGVTERELNEDEMGEVYLKYFGLKK